MNILLSIAGWNPSYGGPFFSVGAMARALASRGNHVRLFAPQYINEERQPPPEGVERFDVAARLIPVVRQAWTPGIDKALDEAALTFQDGKVDIMMDNGLWMTTNHAIAKLAQRSGIKRIVAPRGTLDPWAMKYRNWKKLLALKLFQQKDLDTADAFHACSDLEADNIRTFGMKQPVGVVPNSIHIPDTVSQLPRNEKGERVALFIGRMHPIKNLPNLLRAWAVVRPEGWRLKLIGSSEVGHREELAALAASLDIEPSVELCDPVIGDAKAEVFYGASLGILPSFSENFGMAIAEALSYGLPSIASRKTPWRVLEERDCGWWAEPEVDGLAAALKEATSLDDESLRTRGAKGRALAEERFSTEAVARSMESFYSWINGQGEKPDFVI